MISDRSNDLGNVLRICFPCQYNPFHDNANNVMNIGNSCRDIGPGPSRERCGKIQRICWLSSIETMMMLMCTNITHDHSVFSVLRTISYWSVKTKPISFGYELINNIKTLLCCWFTMGIQVQYVEVDESLRRSCNTVKFCAPITQETGIIHWHKAIAWEF